MDGTKLPLFVIFKGKPNSNIEKQLHSVMSSGMFGCTRSKAWFDERAMLKWYDSVWKPYIAGYDSESGLLLGNYKVHTMKILMEYMTNDKIKRFLIPGNRTSVLQPCDVGINKSLKERLKEAARCRSLPPGSRLPSPKCGKVLNMLQKYGIGSKWKMSEMHLLVADTFSMRT